MLGRLSRALLAALMVAVIAGSAVAFSLGVHFAPRSACNPQTVSYGSHCPGNTKRNLRHIRLVGLLNINHWHGKIHLAITNRNSVRVRIRLVLVFQSRAGKIRRITKTIYLRPHHTFKLNRVLKFKSLRAARLTLTITDTSGNTATIKSWTGKFKSH